MRSRPAHALPRRPAGAVARRAVVAVVGMALVGTGVAQVPDAPTLGRLAASAPAVARVAGFPETLAAAPPAAPPATAAPATAASSALAGRLDALLFNTNSCLEVRDATGRVLYDHGGARALAPASTQKLLVAAAALAALGPDYRFETRVEARRPPVNGEVDDLWLVGGGDPVLSSPEYTAFLSREIEAGHLPVVTTQLDTLSNALAAAGLRSVPGGIHGDDSRYDRTRSLPTWKPEYLTEGDVAPLGALQVDDSLERWQPASDAADPASHAAAALARLAAGAGIAAPAAPDGTAPSGAVVLASVLSPPLSQIVIEMLRNSDNTDAELLVREIDRAVGGPGTTADGVAVVTRELAGLGIPTAGLHLVDGSGLSPSAAMSCDTALAALALGARPGFTSMAQLSVSGAYGTLVNRFLGTPAVGHLAGKTGSIAGVAGLVGRMDVGPAITFAFLLNGSFSYLTGASYQDHLVAALTAYRP